MFRLVSLRVVVLLLTAVGARSLEPTMANDLSVINSINTYFPCLLLLVSSTCQGWVRVGQDLSFSHRIFSSATFWKFWINPIANELLKDGRTANMGER